MKNRTLSDSLKRVASCLYRHDETDVYYAVKKIGNRVARETLGTADRRLADHRLIDWLAQKQANTPTDATKASMTVGQLLTTFLETRTGKKKSTVITEKIIAAKFRQNFDLLGRGMAMPVTRASHSQLVIWLNWIAKSEDGAPLRHSSYNRHRLFLMQLFKFAEVEGVISRSPFDPTQIPAKGRQRVVRLVPTEEEFSRIISEIRHPRWPEANPRKRGGQRPLYQPDAADFAEYLGLAGVGQAEASSLVWEDVDWELRRIRYTRMKTGKSFSHPIYSWLNPVLMRLHAESASKTGRIFKIKDVRHSLTSAVQRLNLPKFTQRSLRAFLISRLWKAAVDVKVIAKWQGHSDGGKLILDTYTEVLGSNDQAYEAAQLTKVENLLARNWHTKTTPKNAGAGPRDRQLKISELVNNSR
jgi:integrase